MKLKSPSQAITFGLYLYSQDFLKRPSEFFAKIIYDDYEFFYDQIVRHKNKSQLSKIARNLKKSDQIAFYKYLTLLLPLRHNPKEAELTFIEGDNWEQLIIDYQLFFALYKIDKNIDYTLLSKAIEQLETTYSESWQTSLNRIIRWPKTDAPLGLEQLFPDGWQETGLLSSSGYTVGNSGATEITRRKILSNLVEQDISLNGFKSSYINSWGKTNSLDRLLKIARTIAVLCRNAKASPNNLEKAITEWESDLAFLKDTYFYTFVNLHNEKWPRT